MIASQIVLDILNKIDLADQDVLVTDNTDYASIAGAYRFDAMIKATIGSTIFYANAGYATNNYSWPDIESADNSRSFSLPTTASDIANGTYIYDYKLRLTYRALGLYSMDYALNECTMLFATNAEALAFKAKINLAPTIVIGGLVNPGTYTVTSSSVSGTDLLFSLAEVFSTDNSITGATVDVYEYFTKQVTFAYCFIRPVHSYSKGFDCKTSRITITDLSTYTATSNSVSLLPTTVARLLTLVYPQLSSPSVNPVTSTSYFLETKENAWTGVYPFTIESDLIYTISTGVRVQMSLDSEDTLEAEDCNTCACEMVTCLATVKAKWYSVLSLAGTVEELKYRLLVTKLTYNFMLYTIYSECNDFTNAAAICAESQALVAETGLGCCTHTTDIIPHVILPLYSSGVGSTIITSHDNSNIVTAISGGYDVVVNQAIIASIVGDVIEAIGIDTTSGIEVDGITAPNCFTITDGMTVSQALQLIITTYCNKLNPVGDTNPRDIVIDRRDLETEANAGDTVARFRGSEEPNYKGTLPTVNDASGAGEAKAEIVAQTYFVDGQNIIKGTETLDLFNNKDNYIYLDRTENDANHYYMWKVSAVTIGAAAPTTTGVKLFKIETGTGVWGGAGFSYLLNCGGIEPERCHFEFFEIIAPGNNGPNQNGNYRFRAEAVTFNLVWEACKANVWVPCGNSVDYSAL